MTKYKRGQKVKVRLPKTMKWFNGAIVKTLDEGKHYFVRFPKTAKRPEGFFPYNHVAYVAVADIQAA